MAYQLNWDARAIDDLAEIWLSARDRAAIDEAVRRLEKALAESPASTGESRSGSSRIAFEAPLVCWFSVEFVRRQVLVHAIWRHVPRGPVR